MTEPHRPTAMTGVPRSAAQDTPDDLAGADQLTDQLQGEIEDKVAEVVAAQRR